MERFRFRRKPLLKFLRSRKADISFESLYVHYPFCRKKCFYCDFYSIEESVAATSNYLEALKSEFELFLSSLSCSEFKTIYIGGGTPSLMSSEEIDFLLNQVIQVKNFMPIEVTFEANPESLSEEKLKVLKDVGATRISLGVQSLDDDILKFIGRIHSSEEALKKAGLIKRFGMDLSIDIMFGIPGQTSKSVLQTVERIIDVEPSSVSAYAFTVKGDKFRGLRLKSQEEYFEEYLLIAEKLKVAGYEHYEVSNWAQPGKKCLHNLNYWQRKNYLGLGPSAASLFNDVRFTCDSSVDKFLSQKSTYFAEVLNEEQIRIEELYLSFRTSLGISVDAIQGERKELLNELKKEGLIQIEDSTVRLTDKGMLVLDAVFSELIL